MFEENVQSIRAGWEDWNRGNRETLFDLIAPDSELHPPRERITSGPAVYYGREGWREYAGQLDELLAGLTYELERCLEGPGGAVLADVIIRGKGVGSGAPFEQRAAHLYEIEGGRMTRMRIFMDRDEARQAAGPWE